MSRLRRIEVAGRYFFITTNLLRHTQPLPPPERDICLEQIDRARSKHRFAMFAYVVMPNHIHLLVWTLESLLPKLMQRCVRSTGPSGRSDILISFFAALVISARNLNTSTRIQWKQPLWVDPRIGNGPAPCSTSRKSVLVRPDLFAVPSDPNEPLWPAPWR